MKKRVLPPLSALHGFEASARHLSFTKAAEELFVTQGAISRQVRQLEDFLAVPLFHRYTRRIELTDAGEEFYTVVSDVLDQLSNVARRVKRRNETDILTVSVLPSFASAWLMPRLYLFTEKHPTIEVRLHTSIDPVSFGSSGPDVAIRVGRVPGKHYERHQPRIDLEMAESWRGIHIDELLPDRLVTVCSPKLLAGRDALTPQDIVGLPLIHTTSRRFAWPDWLHAMGVSNPAAVAGSLEMGHFFMSIEAASQGRGVAIVPDIVARQELELGRLVTACPSDLPSAGDYCLLTPDNNLQRPSIARFRQWLLNQIARYRNEDRANGLADQKATPTTFDGGR